jgi:hypothetical protein
MHHDPKICEDDNWGAHCSDDVTWHNTQTHPVTIRKGSTKWPFDPPGPYVFPPGPKKKCTILPGLSPGPYEYEVEGCDAKATPKTVIIS